MLLNSTPILHPPSIVKPGYKPPWLAGWLATSFQTPPSTWHGTNGCTMFHATSWPFLHGMVQMGAPCFMPRHDLFYMALYKWVCHASRHVMTFFTSQCTNRHCQPTSAFHLPPLSLTSGSTPHSQLSTSQLICQWVWGNCLWCGFHLMPTLNKLAKRCVWLLMDSILCF